MKFHKPDSFLSLTDVNCSLAFLVRVILVLQQYFKHTLLHGMALQLHVRAVTHDFITHKSLYYFLVTLLFGFYTSDIAKKANHNLLEAKVMSTNDPKTFNLH